MCSVVSDISRPHGLYSQLGSCVHGIPQARILEWVAVSFSRGSSPPRDRTQVSCIADDSLLSEPPGKPALEYTRVERLMGQLEG